MPTQEAKACINVVFMLLCLMQNACYVDEFCMIDILASFRKIVALDIYISARLYFLV